MSRMRRAVPVVTAALLALGSLVALAPAAVADPPAAVTVNSTSGSDVQCAADPSEPCQTIGAALALVAPAGRIDILDTAEYDENLVVWQAVTIVGNGAKLAGTFVIDGTSSGVVDVSGMTFESSVSPLIRVADSTDGDTVNIHDNILTGDGTNIGVDVDSNAAATSVDGNKISDVADGIDITGGDAPNPAYNARANTFAGVTGTAVSLAGTASEPLSATVTGNSGTVASGARTITATSADAVAGSAGNSITTVSGSAVSAPGAPLTVTTHEPAKTFSTNVDSAVDLTSPRIDVAVTSAAVGVNDIDLRYRNGNDAYSSVALSGSPGNLTGSLPKGAGIPSPDQATTDYTIAFPTSAPSGPITIGISLDELSSGGSVVNTVATTTIPITVVADSAPVATAPAQVAVPYQTTTAIAVSGSDIDGDALTYAVANGPTHGTLAGASSTATALPAGGTTVEYTPTGGYTGQDHFDYTVSDGARSTSVTVTLVVGFGPPVITAAATVSVPFRSPGKTILLSGSDPANRSLTYTLTAPANGSLDQPSRGPFNAATGLSVKYAPIGRFSGPDPFTFTLWAGSQSSTVTITPIVAADSPPTATDISATVGHTSPSTSINLSSGVQDRDDTALDYFVRAVPNVTLGTLGTISGSSVSYTPPATYAGTDIFEYRVYDGTVYSSWQFVTVTVTKPNHAPVLSDQTVQVPFQASTPVTLGPSRDPDAELITYKVTTKPGRGTVGAVSKNTLTYSAPPAWAGQTTFQITGSDPEGLSDTATVTVIVRKAASTVSLSVTPGRPTTAETPILNIHVVSAGKTTNGTVLVGSARAWVSGGWAYYTLPRYTGGQHTVTATFQGTSTTNASAPVQLSFTVAKVASSLSVTTDPAQLTTTTRNATATVRVTSKSLRANSGRVTIEDNGRQIASGTVRGAVARLRLPTFSLGQHNLTVSYAGTAYIAGSSVLKVERIPLGG